MFCVRRWARSETTLTQPYLPPDTPTWFVASSVDHIMHCPANAITSCSWAGCCHSGKQLVLGQTGVVVWSSSSFSLCHHIVQQPCCVVIVLTGCFARQLQHALPVVLPVLCSLLADTPQSLHSAAVSASLLPLCLPPLPPVNLSTRIFYCSWVAAIILPFVTKKRTDKRAAIASALTLGLLVLIGVVVAVAFVATARQAG